MATLEIVYGSDGSLAVTLRNDLINVVISAGMRLANGKGCFLET